MGKSSARILILFQNEFLIDFFRNFLTGEGYDVSISRWGNGVLKDIGGQELDLILLEDGFPRINGKTFAGKIKEIKDIPIILIVAGGIDRRTILTLQEGASDYIEAPSEIREIRNKIREKLEEINHG